MVFKDPNRQYEYEKLFAYEIELTKSRWTVFAALFSISLLIPGIVLRGSSGIQEIGLWEKCAIAFGFLVFLAAHYHYWWFHRISHFIRAKLKDIEREEGIKIIIVRDSNRPKIGPFYLYLHWMIWVLDLAYAFLTFRIVGCTIFLYFIAVLIASIFIFAVISNLGGWVKKTGNNSSVNSPK